MSESWDLRTDVLVVGAGGCGLVAALAAHEQGVEVAVVEKFDKVGGNTSVSTGSVPGAGTRFQRAAGIDDSPERMLDDLLRTSGPHDVPELTRLLAYQSASLVEWLVDYAGARLELVTDYRHVGHSVPRLHAPRSRKGRDLTRDLVRALEQRHVPIALSNPVSELIADGGGAVIGAALRGERGVESRVGTRKIILATNGFGASPELVRTYCPDIAGATYFGAEGSTGEAIRWGEKLGAGLANMAAYQAYAAVAYPHGSLVSWTTIEKGGIIVNARGERFGDETSGYSAFAREVMREKTLVSVVFDSRIRDSVASNEEEFRELVEYGGVKEAGSAAELARLYGLDPDVLRRSLAAYDAAARGERPDAFGRTDFGLAPLRPPYAICQATPGLFHTQGGLRVDEQARVLGRDGRVIPNLFAGGGAAAGISGRIGGAGYASGNGLLTALGLGRIAGQAAAREVVEGV